MKIDIEEVESVLLEKKFDPNKVSEVIQELQEIAQEVQSQKDLSESLDNDGLPVDLGSDDIPKTKWEHVIILNDKEGYLKDKEIAGWIVQQEENSNADLILSKLKDSAKNQNENTKKRKNIITNLTQLFESLKPKFLKENKVKIKTKDLTRVIITDGKF